MNLQIIFTIIAHILLTVSSTSPDVSSQPVAKCQTGFFYQTLPLIADEAYITNLDHLFNGYNLEYKLQDHEDFKDYITLGDKVVMQGKEIPDTPLIGLKNYHIDKRGNGWGATFIALTQRSERTFVHYGVLNSNKSAPVVNNMISVENNTNTTCFDAVQFKQQDLILVDCVVKLPKPNAKGQILQNIFYYFRISDGKTLKTVKTEMYISYRDIQRRSLLLYSDLMNEHTFLLRTYFYDGMDKTMSENTYIEVFMINDPNDPWIVEIIDRSFLNTKALSITDVRIYLGEIFILDQKMGLYRVYINTEEDLKINGYYEVKGFERFSVFSSNLEDNFELALVNSHTALQIDWTNRNDPRLINKYSLMPNSKVSQIFLNDRFVFIQSSSTAQNITYNYTWIMNRGDRTYTKAFKTIRHASAKTIIDLNEDMSYLIVIDDQKLANYAIDDTNMVIKLKNVPELIDKINTFKITATSKDDMVPKVNKTCQIVINFTLLEDNNKTMWPIGEMPPSQFTANYPGKVEIRLHEYVFGPNITYKLRQVDHDVVKKLKVYQQQPLQIVWEVAPPLNPNSSIKFLLSETINYEYMPNDLMHLYLQDDTNMTFFVQCLPDHFKENVTCNFTHQEQFEGEVNSWVSGFFLNRYTQQENHIIAYTTKQQTNKVRIVDFTQKEQLEDVQLQKGFAGNATSIAITNKEMYVVVKYVKNIRIYDLELCLDGICDPKCQLNHLKMYQLGVKYFSPMEVHTSIFHTNIIFIKTSDQIIVVDYNAECKPKLLAKFNPVATAESDFHFKLNEKFLIVTIGSMNIINEYNIERIALGQIRLTKQYPRYGYSLPKVNDIDVSDKGNCIYVTMDNQDGDHQVFVYRSGYPAVGTLYDVIDLTSTDPVLVDTTGYEIDYVSVYANKQLHIFRQYQQPLAEVFNPNISYSFYVQYSNPISHSNLEQINVKIINLPTYITVNPFLSDIMNTKDLLYSGYYRVNEINDSAWWQGNVVVVEGDCDSCRGPDPIIKVMNHIQHQEEIKLVPAMSEYEWTQKGGSIQAMNSIVNMLPNGTIAQYVKLPFIQNSLCITQAIGNRMDYHVSGCLSDNSINLYLTSFVSDKGFAFEPFETTAANLFKLEAVHDLIILVDADNDAYRKTRPGGVYLFSVNMDDEIPTSIVEVEYINGDDIGMDEFGDLYINNAELTYHPSTQSYRLYITEMTRGIFTIDFKYNDKSNTILIRAINYLKIEPLLTKLGYQLPYDASYQAITKMSSVYDQTLKKITDKMLVTTGKFHTIQLSIDFSTSGTLQEIKITRLYMRYSFYNIQNYIKYHNNLFVISQILPDEFDIQNRSKQLLTTYSTSDNRSFTDDRGDDYIDDETVEDNKTIEERGFLGGFKVDDTVMHYYDFNLSYNDDGHTEPRVGMVLIEYLSNKLQKFTLHQNLSVVTKEEVDTQIIYLDLKNDFSIQKIRILINGRSPYPEWKFITIILFSIIGAFLLIGVMAFGIMKLKNKYLGGGQSRQDMMQDSLLTGSDRKSFQPLSLRESQDMTQAKQSKKDEKKRVKQQEKQRKLKEKQLKQRQKQRQRQERQREKSQRGRQKSQRERQKQSQRQIQRSTQRQRQAQKEREKQSQRERQREGVSEKESTRERERQRERERERQRQRQRLSQRQRQTTMSTTSRFETRPTSNNNLESGYGEEDTSSRFGQRRAFRDRGERPSRNNDDGLSTRPPPPSRRRNNAIIED